MPIDLDHESAYANYEFDYMDRGNVSVSTARFVSGVLEEGRHTWEIVRMLTTSRITEEVLEQSTVIAALRDLENDNLIRKEVQRLLLRLMRISMGKRDALNEAIESIFRSEGRDFLTQEEQDRFYTDSVQNRIMKKGFALMASEEKKAVQKRKMQATEERPAKKRKPETHEKSSRKPAPEPKALFVFPSYHGPSYDDELQKYRSILISEEIKFSPAMKLALQITLLPMVPTSVDVQPLLEGINAADLEEAEAIVGREMNRADAVWWELLFRDFGRVSRKRDCGIRELYRRKGSQPGESKLDKSFGKHY